LLRHVVLGVLRVAKEIPSAGSRMKNTIKTIIVMMCACCVVCSGALALDMSGVRAYPVPYNPEKSIGLKLLLPAVPDISGIIKISIFDINGDLVFNREYSSVGLFVWNGRNLSGRKVKPGLYIIKVSAEGSNGEYGKKLIRILVDYR